MAYFIVWFFGLCDSMPAHSIFDEHLRRNRTTRERWEAMASHRARVMELLEAARGRGGKSLCLLGVGNGNDVDLSQLTVEFEQITLVDLDLEALRIAVERVPKESSGSTILHGSVDLTGILPILEAWRNEQPADAEISSAIGQASSASVPDVSTYDVVASTCVLTQLIDSVCLALPTNHPRFLAFLMAVRNRHLEMIVGLLHPGGTGIVVSDFVSTATAPELATLEDQQIPQAAEMWLKRGNFFTGANPYSIRDYLQKIASIEDVQVLKPWRWNIGARQFAVSGVVFQRRDQD